MKLELSVARRKLSLVFVLGFVCSTVSATVEITDLGTLGGGQSIAYGINDRDQVVGESSTADQETHIFLYRNGLLTDVGGGLANDINNRGRIAGNLPNGHAAIMYPGAITDLGMLGGIYSTALGINDADQAVGYYSSPGSFHHAFFYSRGDMKPLGPFGAEAISIATGINNLGMIVGSATDSFLVPYHAFLYSNGVMTDIGNSESYAHRINNRGQIVGEYLTAGNTAFHAFIYSGGTFTDIGSENSSETVAYDINESGQTVGVTWVLPDNSCRECNEESHAFLYENGVLTDLNTVLPAGSGWTLAAAYAINNKGNIVGYGLIHGQFHAFLLRWSHFQRPSAAGTQPEGSRSRFRAVEPR